MLVACKCLNLIASSGQIVKNISELNNLDNNEATSLSMPVHGVNLLELTKYRKNSNFYSECADFLRQAIGPVTDLTINYSQADLIFDIPIDCWILHFCINCFEITHAEKNNSIEKIYLINSNLLTNNEDIAQRKAEPAYSTTFGLLMIDHQRLKASFNSTSPIPTQINTAKYQNRLTRLNQNFKNRLEQEIFETDERIHRFTEQQLNLLKIFREKSEQEYQILFSLLMQVPEEIQEIDAINCSNLCATNNQLPPNDALSNNTNATTSSALEFIDSNDSTSAINNTQNSVSSQVFSFNNKVSNFDTPPATPDSTPMSIGNSPTFRQQTSLFGSGNRNSNGSKNQSEDDECLFELEGVECYPTSVSLGNNAMSDVEETEDGEDALGELDSGLPTSRYVKRSSLSMARSLPISIAPINSKINNIVDSDDEVPEDNVDIAASIKALAKSLHGDTVFGDLPRPRFSTQI